MNTEHFPGLERLPEKDEMLITVDMDTCWWASLGVKDISELALILSKRAVRSWENYYLHEDLKSQLVPVKNLPSETLEEIEKLMNSTDDQLRNSRLNDLFRLFVTPVIQFQDGDLKLPYEVRSAFLSVFNIVRGLLSTRNQFVAIQCFSSSITRSLDAIKISNLLNHKEISQLTRKYLLLSGKK